MFCCPATGLNEHQWIEENVEPDERAKEAVSCLACAQLHLISSIRRTVTYLALKTISSGAGVNQVHLTSDRRSVTSKEIRRGGLKPHFVIGVASAAVNHKASQCSKFRREPSVKKILTHVNRSLTLMATEPRGDDRKL